MDAQSPRVESQADAELHLLQRLRTLIDRRIHIDLALLLLTMAVNAVIGWTTLTTLNRYYIMTQSPHLSQLLFTIGGILLVSLPAWIFIAFLRYRIYAHCFANLVEHGMLAQVEAAQCPRDILSKADSRVFGTPAERCSWLLCMYQPLCKAAGRQAFPRFVHGCESMLLLLLLIVLFLPLTMFIASAVLLLNAHLDYYVFVILGWSMGGVLFLLLLLLQHYMGTLTAQTLLATLEQRQTDAARAMVIPLPRA